MSLTAHDWLKNGGLVMFESAIPMVDGSFAYSKLGNTFDTPELSLKIIERFKKLNDLKQHSDILNLLKKTNASNASQVLKDLLDQFSETPRALLVIDQINALYSKSCYFDQESNQLSSHKLYVSQLFQKLIKSNKMSTLAAQDYSNTLFPAYAFQEILEKNGGYSKPSSLNIAQDLFPRDLLPEKVKVESLKNLSKSQVTEWMEIYSNQGVISKSSLFEKNFGVKIWTFTNGNPSKLFNSSLKI